MTSFQITLDDEAARNLLRKVERVADDADRMYAEIADHLVESTQRRFGTAIAPDGTPWVPLKRGNRKPLMVSGDLRNQIAPDHGRNFAEVYSTMAYAPFHQFGTAPYVILPKKGTVLAFPGSKGTIFARRVNHPGLPARPFLGVSENDWVNIREIALAYLTD